MGAQILHMPTRPDEGEVEVNEVVKWRWEGRCRVKWRAVLESSPLASDQARSERAHLWR